MADDKVSVEISIEERAALKALTQLTKGLDNFEKQAVTSVKKTDAAFDSFKGNLAAIATSNLLSNLLGGIKNLALGSLEAAAQTEKLTTQFTVLTGSADKANKLFQQLTDFSASTPFQLNNIAEAGAQLLSFGFAAESVQGRIAKIGEVAAGSGSDLKEVALIYGQVAAAGKLTGERLLQLQERAIPIGSALASSLGVAESEVRDLVSSGVVGFKEFEKAFNSLSESGGLFEGAIDKQSKTLNGAISTLKDNFQILQTQLGQTFAPEVVEATRFLTQAMQDLTKAVIDNKDTFSQAIGFVKDYVVTYANLAAELIKTETPLDVVNQKIKENVEQAQQLIDRKKDLEDDKGAFFGVFDAATQQSIDKVNSLLKNNQAQLKLLIDERKKLQETQFASDDAEKLASQQAQTDMINQQKVQSEQETNLKILEERRKLYSDLLMLEQEQMQLEAERDLAASELDVEKRVQALEQIKFHEIQKADIALEAELEKNKKIRDARSKELADQQAFARNQLAISRSQAKAEASINQARVENQDKMVQGFGLAASQAASIAKKGTNEQKLFAVAAATINTYAAATRAFRDYPYPANLAVMATTIAAGLNQVSQIQKQSFFTGGVVGGFSGATNGMDNTTANVRTGEMVLNGNQQRQLFDIATGKENTGSGELISAINRLASQAITVEVDGREIARTVRNQRLEGFI